jgi:hypothetical protein
MEFIDYVAVGAFFLAAVQLVFHGGLKKLSSGLLTFGLFLGALGMGLLAVGTVHLAPHLSDHLTGAFRWYESATIIGCGLDVLGTILMLCGYILQKCEARVRERREFEALAEKVGHLGDPPKDQA